MDRFSRIRLHKAIILIGVICNTNPVARNLIFPPQHFREYSLRESSRSTTDKRVNVLPLLPEYSLPPTGLNHELSVEDFGCRGVFDHDSLLSNT